MLPRWLRGVPDPDPNAPNATAIEPVAAELSEIVCTLLAQTAILESMIERGDGAVPYQGRRDSVVAALEQARARVEEARLVLRQGQRRTG